MAASSAAASSGVDGGWSEVADALEAAPASAPATGRIWCVSDVHTDHKENLEWCEGLATLGRFANDTLILASDVTASNELLEAMLSGLSERAAKLIKDDLEVLGRVRKADVEAARREVVQVALRLEAEGTIDLGREDE